MSEFRLSQINVFPVKSLGGISQNSACLTRRGLRWDRRWMLVDAKGQFLTQREFPQLCFLQVILQPDHLLVEDRRSPSSALKVPLQQAEAARRDVQVWKSRCRAETFSPQVDRWFQRVLSIECQLVYMPEDEVRSVEPDFQQDDDIVSFADGFPCLIIGEASLLDLNQRLPTPVTMDRFRTNFVFSGGKPFAEDRWKSIWIGEVEFRVVKPCPRCLVTTIDPQTGESGVEPLRTLASYRRHESGGVMFGQNLVPRNLGEVAVGMPIEVLDEVAGPSRSE